MARPPSRAQAPARSSRGFPIRFGIWGCRGSRNRPPRSSRFGVYTSCYSLQLDSRLLIVDAGRGLMNLSQALFEDPDLQRVDEVHLLVSHSHMDHWEGLKDAAWFWNKRPGLSVTLYGTGEALDAIRAGHAPPSFVELEILALGNVNLARPVRLQVGYRWQIGPALLSTHPLNHYSGSDDAPRHLDAIGFRIDVSDGPSLAYLSDHQPTPATTAVEDKMGEGTHLIIYDAHFGDIAEQAYGHGSQEHAAGVARRRPEALVIATHHGAGSDDTRIEQAYARHGAKLKNFRLAREGDSYVWDPAAKRFSIE